MTDDWSSPTGEYEPATSEGAADVPDLARVGGDIDPVIGVTAGELRMVDALFHELALEAAADPRPPTPDEQRAVEYLRRRFEQLKAMSPEEEAMERERLLQLDD